MIGSFRFAGWVIVSLIASDAMSAVAQDPANRERGEPSQAKAWAERAAKMALAEARAWDIRLEKEDGPQAKLIEQPVLKWSNTYEASVYGSAFVWTQDGRPAAIACIYKFFTTDIKFDAEFHSLATAPLVAIKEKQTAWQPQDAGVEFKWLAAAATPAKTAGQRLVQMRDLAREFSADMTAVIDKTQHRLRLLTQPLYRYRSGSQAVLDGAIFAFARETDPDVLLLLEATAPSEGKSSTWQFAIARMHVGALLVKHGDKEVWSVTEMSWPYGRKNERYSLFQKIPEPKVD
ncbi:MAG TPA: ATP-binding protein [Pirellulaceae bacterium]|nr:ATP-binding protein [Pirellulaceae bacterium]